jgi:8-oxo-dGTP pyrophosphatase MutT (NUDIX family)
MAEHTAKEQNTFYNQQPAKHIGAGAWLEDEAGRLLIAKPNYKQGWTLIGGIVDKDEAPLDAVIRETHEEIGITLEPTRFTLVGYRYVEARDGRDEDTQLYFKAILTPEEIGMIALQASELSEYRFVTKDEIDQYADVPRMQAVAAVMGMPTPFYIHNETRRL